MKFVIDGKLSGMNDIIGLARIHWAASNTLKKKETQRCAEAIIAHGIPILKRPFMLHFHWFESNKRRDLDNICAAAKFVLDGMVLSNRIPFDTRKWVTGIIHSFPEPDKKNPRVEVEILLSEGEG